MTDTRSTEGTALTLNARPFDGVTLGATALDGGVNFAVTSTVAEGITVCLFDSAGNETHVELEHYDAGVWHGFVPGLTVGQAYGYRVNGPFDPAAGVRCNPRKLLLDPYARAIAGAVTYDQALLGHDPADPGRPSGADSAPYTPRSLVTADPSGYDWEGDAPLLLPYADTVLYETHVKGFTMRHPDVPPEVRGSFAGLAHDAATGYLRDLGVTAVELLPTHEYVSEAALLDHGLTNYWGYNSIGFFAPHHAYSSAARQTPGAQVTEFKDMVKALHRAGIEVILDVVYNHTAEGSDRGPTLCFRGLDNALYYRLDPGDASRYYDTTGTGNSLNAGNPYTLRLIMDSLRYWLTEMHVDGFRFDLAATLARGDGHFDATSSFFELVAQDPIVSRAKLIAEPWDVGQGDSYDLGKFPGQWREWNGKYRDGMRDYWRSKDVGVAEFATRFTGSSDLYGAARRRPTASVNLITVHDGFTLRDLVSYDRKHNEANDEENRDGTDDNRSWNCGAEGPTDDADVNALRGRQARAMLSTLLLSFGMPMLLGGDEIGRTQGGNNNAYCQDNEISWFDWEAADNGLRDFVKRLLELRRSHPVFRRQRFLTGADAAELGWCASTGTGVTDEQWVDPTMHAMAIYLDGTNAPDQAQDGTPLLDDDFLILVNAWWEPVTFTLPPVRETTQTWFIELDSYDPAVSAAREFPRHTGDQVVACPRSLTVLRAPRPDQDETD
jgi:glycogen operon protein